MHPFCNLGIALIIALGSGALLVGLTAIIAFHGLKRGWWKE
jgi:hypothetical protein